jgi:hypothetical protein
MLLASEENPERVETTPRLVFGPITCATPGRSLAINYWQNILTLSAKANELSDRTSRTVL